MDRIRVTFALTHPIQYYTPWFRHIASHVPELDLQVVYAAQPSVEQQGIGFNRPFQWDSSLLDGYPFRFVRKARAEESLECGRFFGLNVTGVSNVVFEGKPDVVVVPGWHSVTLARVLLACKSRGIPVLYRGDTHLGNAPNGWKKNLWLIKVFFALRMFSGYLSVGMRTRRFLRRFGIPDNRIFDAPHFVDNRFFEERALKCLEQFGKRGLRARFGLKPGTFTLLFAGKLEEKKHPLDVIEAIRNVSADVQLLIVGSGALETECRAAAKDLDGKVQFAGFLNQSEIPAAYAAADCLVLPSDWGETWGLVVNEAFATGLPAILSDRVGCALDLVKDEQTGCLFAFGDTAGLQGRIEQLIQQIGRGRDFGPACKELAQRFSVSPATEGLILACRAVVRN